MMRHIAMNQCIVLITIGIATVITATIIAASAIVTATMIGMATADKRITKMLVEKIRI
jgi:hypothetical protein